MAAGARPSESALVDFVYREARLLDEKRFDEWYELFTDDALYWMPLTRGQPGGEMHTSLFYEDRLLLKVRIERLRTPTRSHNSSRASASTFCSSRRWKRPITRAGRYVMRTPFLYVETQLDRQLILAGRCPAITLSRVEGALRIRLKKIELLNCDAALAFDPALAVSR